MATTSVLFTAAGALLALGLAAPSRAEAARPGEALPLRLTAVAVNLGGLGRVGVTPVDVVIERWSTDAERDRLRDALVEKGSDSLMDALQAMKPRAGYIRTPTSLAWDIQYAREETLPSGGRRIVFGTDRPMSFLEVANNTRSSEYDFMLGEIRVGPDGRGAGKLFPAAKVTWNKDERAVEVENWDAQPVRLQDVRAGSK